MKWIVFTFLSSVIFFNTFAQDEVDELRVIEVRIIEKDKPANERLTIGSETNVNLELSEGLPVHFFQAIFNNKFVFNKAIFLSNIKELTMVKPGLTNLLEAKASFVSPIIPKTNFEIPIEQMGIKLRLININLEVFDDAGISKTKLPKALEQNLNTPKSYWLAYLGGFVLLCMCIYVIFKYVLKRKRERHLKQLSIKWFERIKKAESRSDIEYIYSVKNKWKNYIQFSKAKIANFENTISSHQYKKDWGEVEWSEIKSSLKQMISTLDMEGK